MDVVIAFKHHLYATYLKILSTSLYVWVIYMPVSMYILIVSRKYAAIDKYQLTSLYNLHVTSMNCMSMWVRVISKFNGTSTPKGSLPKQVIMIATSIQVAIQSKNCTVWEHLLSGQVWTKCPTRPDTQGAPREGCSLHPWTVCQCLGCIMNPTIHRYTSRRHLGSAYPNFSFN